MLLLEYVKTVCFLTSERAGAQISAAFGVSSEGKANRTNLGLGRHPEGLRAGETLPRPPGGGGRLSCLGLPARLLPKDHLKL